MLDNQRTNRNISTIVSEMLDKSLGRMGRKVVSQLSEVQKVNFKIGNLDSQISSAINYKHVNQPAYGKLFGDPRITRDTIVPYDFKISSTAKR